MPITHLRNQVNFSAEKNLQRSAFMNKQCSIYLCTYVILSLSRLGFGDAGIDA